MEEVASGQEGRAPEQGGLLAEWQGGRISRGDQAATQTKQTLQGSPFLAQAQQPPQGPGIPCSSGGFSMGA